MQLHASATAELAPVPQALDEPRQTVPVPWWCQRRALDLLNRLGAIGRHDTAVIQRVMAPLIARVKSKPHARLRSSMEKELERDWDLCLNNQTRLAPLIVDRHPKGLVITDCRVSIIGLSFTDWPLDRWEKGLVLVLTRLNLLPGAYGLKLERLAFVSAHALGRMYERSMDSSDAALFASMQHLLIDHERMLAQPVFAARSPIGYWVGRSSEMPHGERVLEVRSFIREFGNGKH